MKKLVVLLFLFLSVNAFAVGFVAFLKYSYDLQGPSKACVYELAGSEFVIQISDYSNCPYTYHVDR